MMDTKILVAENHAGTVRELRRCLKELGYQLTAVVSRGELALGQVSENKPDLVLIDVRLPGKIDGVQVAERIRNQGVPIVFLANRGGFQVPGHG